MKNLPSGLHEEKPSARVYDQSRLLILDFLPLDIKSPLYLRSVAS